MSGSRHLGERIISRILFMDLSEAFHFINHNVLLQKFLDYKFPPHITIWSLVFIQDREQFVSIGNKTSTILKSNAGNPQGTIAGPNDFKLLINVLLFDINNANYVDDIMTSQCRQSQLILMIVHYSQQPIM